ncbi:MAG TPA: DUF1440 domain-containing protein [Longimicrobiaceae bacterium]|nr:DUF1440 domain-containing protein [Longimicrobiaceae bacterium]
MAHRHCAETLRAGDGIGSDLLHGALAGALAWWAMDQLLRYLYDHMDPQVRRREDAARGGVPALEVMAQRMAGPVGLTLSEEERQRAGTALQWVTGSGAGMLYAALRDRIPGSGMRRGLAYGAAFALVMDEGMIPLLGFSPGPLAFPWQTHARGLAGHLVYGVVVELAMQGLESYGGLC